MRRHFTRLLAATALLAAAPAIAQDNADLFSKLDANKDGFVTADEVQDSQKALFERLVRNADKDGDKKLSQDEFQAGLKPDETPKQPLAGGQGFGGRPGGAKGDPREIFNRIDANKDGKLSKEELPQQNFAQIDVDGDGFVTPEEFARRVFGQRPPGSPPAATPQTAPDTRRAEEIFAQGDANKDGKWTKDEVSEGLARERFNRMLENINPGGDSITKEQYLRGAAMFFAQGGVRPPAPGGRPNPGAALDRGQIEALFDRTDSNSDGKLTKDEIPEERPGMRSILERSGGDSISKDQFVRGMMAMMQPGGQPPRPEGAQPRPDSAPPRRPDGPPGAPPGGGLFGTLDTDRDGQLSTSEIVGAGTALMKLDRNGDGKLTPDEAFGPGGMPAGRPGDARPGVGRPGGGFNLETFDKDKDGKVSKEEAPDRLKERFDQVDTNGDGFLDQAEFRQMAERMQKAGGKAPPRRPKTDNK